MDCRTLISAYLIVWSTRVHAIILPSTSRQPLPPLLDDDVDKGLDETPEGYYAFVESPNVEPPQVRPPPYFKSDTICPGVTHSSSSKSTFNLCGDLNKGFIPMNPMRQNVLGSPYPFDLLKNKTLEFFSKALPILQADDTLPKVAKYQTDPQQYYSFENDQPSKHWDSQVEPDLHHRTKRDDRFQQSLNVLRGIVTGQEDVINSTRRIARKFCEHGGGVLCMLYRAVQGEPLATGMVERRDDDLPELRSPGGNSLHLDGPPTPCPAKVEYATPVFARNYQGIWRYVVQIPYEGYFTQTIEITRCMQSKCYYMEGGCLSSPRWVSLLVAEIYYPESFLPTNRKPSAPRTPVQGEDPPVGNYNQYLHREGEPAESLPRSIQTSKPSHCDGVDKLGCFQVRLYYDWFLVPGSCKCWRPDYFSRYVRRKNSGAEL